MPLARKLLGIGIDLVSRSRIKRFLASHSRKFLNRLLTPSEQILFQKSSNAVEFFARSFAAKEAYFKARGGIALREADFHGIEIRMKDRSRFFALNADVSQSLRTEGEFFESPDDLGAKVVIWRG